MAKITAFQYAKAEFQAGRYPRIGYCRAAGQFRLTDHIGWPLSDPPFESVEDATDAKHAIIERARSAHHRA